MADKQDNSPEINTIKWISRFATDETIGAITGKYGLIYLAEAESTGEVCFAHSAELRDDYKQSFTHEDLLYYGYALLNSQAYKALDEIEKRMFLKLLLPSGTGGFWKLVELGKRLRKIRQLNDGSTIASISHLVSEIDNLL